MNNDIIINPEEIKKLPDNSIMDYETIRQIALYGIKHNDDSLNCKVNKEFTFAGLYPEVMSIHNINPEPYILTYDSQGIHPIFNKYYKRYSGGLDEFKYETIKTGIEDIDILLQDGLRISELSTTIGKPSVGKSDIIRDFNVKLMRKAKELGLTVILNGVEINKDYLDGKQK